MNQLNSLILEGTVINEPEVVALDAFTSERIVKFTIANDRFYLEGDKPKQETLFLVIQCKGDIGERALNDVHRGQLARLAGRLFLTRWKTRTGESRSSMEMDLYHYELKGISPEYQL